MGYNNPYEPASKILSLHDIFTFRVFVSLTDPGRVLSVPFLDGLITHVIVFKIKRVPCLLG